MGVAEGLGVSVLCKGNTQANSPVDQGADTVTSENKPWGLCFSKAIFEGLIFGGAYVRRGLCSEGLMYGGKFAFKNRLG